MRFVEPLRLVVPMMHGQDRHRRVKTVILERQRARCSLNRGGASLRPLRDHRQRWLHRDDIPVARLIRTAPRTANAALPGYIVDAGEWLDSIWRERATFTDRPSLVLWGLRDIAFRKKELDRWKSELTDVEAHEFQDCGHFLAEEAPEKVVRLLRVFMNKG